MIQNCIIILINIAVVVNIFALVAGCSDSENAVSSNDSGSDESDAINDTGIEHDGDVTEDGSAMEDSGAAAELLVELSDGTIKGEQAGNTLRFLGIPFAAPPTSELRWRPPQPVEPWDGVRDATQLPPACSQNPASFMPLSEISEDCLYLNVWTPDLTPDEPIPVMVWLHGGGNSVGGGVELRAGASEDQPKQGLHYNGQHFIDAAPRPIIIVTTNYRLGPFGFFSHPGLTAEEGTSGNYGLRDQQAALRWVRDNIAAFGGDPENVTLFGESAGALDTCLQIMTPDSAGLFDRAIMQSAGPCFPKRWRSSLQEAEQAGEEFATYRGCTDGDDAEIIKCLRGLSAEKLIEWPSSSGDPLPGGYIYAEPIPMASFLPIIDGVVLPESIEDIVASGRHTRIPLIVGTTGSEGDFFHHEIIGAIPVETEEEYLEALQRRLGDAADAVAAEYPISDYETANQALADVTGDSVFICPARNLARALTEQGNAVFEYNYTHELGFSGLASLGLNNTHAADLPLIWNYAASVEGATADDEAVSATMMDYWTRFAYTGDPNGDDAPEWPMFNTDTEPEIVLDNPVSTTQSRKSDKCDLWATIE